jgi:hypothetical protein
MWATKAALDAMTTKNDIIVPGPIHIEIIPAS